MKGGINTDITIGTDADRMLRFYKEACREISDLEVKRDMFCAAYLAEMRKANIPFVLNGEFLKDLTDATAEGKARVAMFIENIFTEGFRAKFDIIYAGKSIGGEEGYFYTPRFHIGQYEYALQCPCPRHMPEKFFAGQFACVENMKYRADCLPIDKVDSLARSWECLYFPTYEWHECVEAIEKHANETANGGRIELC